MLTIEVFDFELKYDETTLRVNNREGVKLEFKQAYHAKKVAKYLRTMAAMANAKGGAIIFGVVDKPRVIKGIEETMPDPADLADSVSQYFAPTIDCDVYEETIKGKNVGIIQVSESGQKPVICKKTCTMKTQGKKERDETVLEEGAIYYRYTAKSAKIQYVELKRLLEKQKEDEVKSFLQNLEIIQKLGSQNIGIVNTRTGDIGTNVKAIYVSDATAKNLNLIKKGVLTEDKNMGAPAYHILGEVTMNKGIEVPILDSDRILPKEAKSKLAQIFKDQFPSVFPDGKFLNDTQVKRIACSLNLRDTNNKGNHNTKYCFYDTQIRRFFYRNAFIERIMREIETNKAEIQKLLEVKKYKK